MEEPEVLVIGAGVIGLTTAVTLAESGRRTLVVADQIPGQTSLVAGASWGPYLVQPYDEVTKWSAGTLRVLADLASIPGSGVRLVSGIEASRVAATLPEWTTHLPNVEECRQDDLPPGFTTGWRYTVPVIDMPRHLEYLLARLHRAGGRVEPRHINDITELAARHRVVVNCTGLGSRDLAADDSIYPIRGQLVVISNPGIDTFFTEDTGDSPNLTHYLPQRNTIVLGGTAIPHDWDLTPDPAVTQDIIARCAAIEPRLANATVLHERVGIRPTRPNVRLGLEHSTDSRIVHNYGHGGAGVSLSWGCAQAVQELITA